MNEPEFTATEIRRLNAFDRTIGSNVTERIEDAKKIEAYLKGEDADDTQA